MRVGVSYMFPRDFGQIFIPMNSSRSCATVRRFADLLPWLVRYTSRPHRIARCTARWPNCLDPAQLIEHEALIAEAGVPELLRGAAGSSLFSSEPTLAKRSEILSER